MSHAEQVALALFAHVGHQQEPAFGFRQPGRGLKGAGDGQQGGEAGPVVGDPGTVEAAARVQRDILRMARRQHGIQVGGEGHVRRRAERRQDIAGAIDGGIAAVGAELLQEPGGAFLLQKGGSGHAAKLHVDFVDPLLLAGEELQAFADPRVVRELGQVRPR